MFELEPFKNLLREELHLDNASADLTTLSIVDPSLKAEGRVVAKEKGVFSGTRLCRAFQEIEKNLSVEWSVKDGSALAPGQELILLKGPASLLLSTERTFLNFLSLSCGVATLTSRYVAEVAGFDTKILATRKTLPGLRALQLEAVVAGGGAVHRRSLSDGILIKDNHLMACEPREALRRARAKASPLHKVEIEVESLSQLQAALEAKPDIVMLDNFSLSEACEALKLIEGRCLVEISGGISLENVRQYAQLGVDFISIGRLTHSAPAFDLSMELQKNS